MQTGGYLQGYYDLMEGNHMRIEVVDIVAVLFVVAAVLLVAAASLDNIVVVLSAVAASLAVVAAALFDVAVAAKNIRPPFVLSKSSP